MKISGIYKIINTITGDFYIGSSKDVKSRWTAHKCKSTWNEHPNNQMYLDMQKYGVDKFEFEILAEVEPVSLKEKEQKFIETLKPTYNSNRANGFDFERYKEAQKKAHNKYDNQLCFYNGETLTLHALYQRFRKQGLSNPAQEAKKYIIQKINQRRNNNGRNFIRELYKTVSSIDYSTESIFSKYVQ